MWTAGIIAVYFTLYNTLAVGLNKAALTNPLFQLISIIFAAKIGSLITVGISPIVLSSIIIQLISGSGLMKIDMNDPVQKARMQTVQKLAAICLAVVEAVIFVSTGYVATLQGFFGIVVLQLVVGAIIIIYLDEMMTKYGITSGINMFIASGVSYAFIAGTLTILLPAAIQAITTGGAAAISNALLAFGPLFFAIIVLLISIYIYGMKVELPLAFEQFRGLGTGRLPIPFLYVSVLPVILATSLELAMSVWFRFLANIHGALGNVANFIALYSAQGSAGAGTSLQLSGGLIYLISPNFQSPYAAPYGIGGYGAYFHYLATQTSTLILPWGGQVLVPEFIHVVLYIAILVVLCVVFGKFWVELTGQSPKNMAEQLGEMGWQIPGFRRDPRIVENVLNKYVPTLTTLGSISVGLLAALATLTGAIGSGMGILLTVGIIYMVYQQLERENVYEAYPLLNKIVK